MVLCHCSFAMCALILLKESARASHKDTCSHLTLLISPYFVHRLEIFTTETSVTAQIFHPQHAQHCKVTFKNSTVISPSRKHVSVTQVNLQTNCEQFSLDLLSLESMRCFYWDCLLVKKQSQWKRLTTRSVNCLE